MAGDLVYKYGGGLPGDVPVLTFRVQDDGGTANGGIDTDFTAHSLTVHLVPPPDSPPISSDVTVITAEDVPYTFGLDDFPFSDPCGLNLKAIIVNMPPTNGRLADNGGAVDAGQTIPVADLSAGKLRFTPSTNGNGAFYAKLIYQVQDDGGTADGGIDINPSPRTVTINVLPVNDPPQRRSTSVKRSLKILLVRSRLRTSPSVIPPIFRPICSRASGYRFACRRDAHR